MPENTSASSYDIVIAGGGPSGLLLASELSRDYSVLVLEKNKVGETKYGWCSWAANAKGQGDCIVSKNEKLLVDFHGSSSPVIEKAGKSGGVVNFDDKKFLKKYADLATANGTKFVEGNAYTDFESDGKRVTISTSKGEKYEARLLIDATGVESPTVKKHRLIKPRRQRYYSVYGGILENAPIEDENIGNFARTFYKSNPPESWEMLPRGNGRATAWIVVAAEGNSPGDPKDLKEKYFRIKDKYLEWKEGRLVEEKYGTIPLVELKHHAFDNVLLVGDAGGWTPAFTGAGFSMILSNYKRVALEIKENLDAGKLDSASLEKIDISKREKWNNDIQQCMIAAFCNSGPDFVVDGFELFKKTKLTGAIEDTLMAGLSRGKMRKHALNMLKDLGPIDAVKLAYLMMSKIPLREYPAAFKIALECAFLP